MLDIFKQLLGFGPKADFAALAKEGAIILDVRTKAEYASGHIQGSLNIPVELLGQSLHKLKDKEKVIITCCASGMRSSAARSLLRAKGYARVYNGGGWSALRQKLGV
jgi:phage shock protein E